MAQNTSNQSPHKTSLNWKELLRIAAKPAIFLLFLIMVCAFLAHYLTGSETLEEYARNNPSTAYGVDDDTGERPPDNNAADSNPLDTAPDFGGESADTPDTEASAETPVPDTEASSDSSAYNSAKESVPDVADSETEVTENEVMDTNTTRTTYQPGFYYEALSEDIKQRITGISYPEEGCTVPYEDLNYVGLLYIDFDGNEQTGELICNQAIAQDMVEIFYELYRNDYRIERVRLIDEYGGDDTLSMMDNNTSCFNYRVVDGTDSLSKHALGCAIDINPFYNPYVVFNRGENGETYFSPKGSEIYADRSQSFPYKIDENDLCYRLFTEHGFTWGGNWNSCKDYQHFQIIL